MKMKRKLILATSIATGIALTLLSLSAKALGLSAEEGATASISDAGAAYIGAGLAVGLAGLGSSFGMGSAGAAAIGAVSENEDLFGTALIFVVLIEAVAIYGLLVAILLIFARA